MNSEAIGPNLYNDPQLARFYQCQAFLLGKKTEINLSNGYQSIKEEYSALSLILRKYYKFESSEDGLIAYNKRV